MIWWILFFVLYAVADAWHDYLCIEGKSGWHSVDAGIKLSVFLFLAYQIYNPTIELNFWTDIFWLTFAGLSVRWVVFDLCLNLFRGKKWYYVADHGIEGFLGSWSFYAKVACLFFTACFFHYLSN
jgi:hypothetical protein